MFDTIVHGGDYFGCFVGGEVGYFRGPSLITLPHLHLHLHFTFGCSGTFTVKATWELSLQHS